MLVLIPESLTKRLCFSYTTTAHHPYRYSLRHLQHAQHFEFSCRRSSSNKNSSKASPHRSNAKMFTPGRVVVAASATLRCWLLEDMYHTEAHSLKLKFTYERRICTYIHTCTIYRVIGFSPQFPILDEFYAIE